MVSSRPYPVRSFKLPDNPWVQTKKSLRRKSRRKSQRPRSKLDFRQNPFQQRDLSTVNVFAEIRGKYARPSPKLNKFNDILQSTQNSIVKRPVTAGSLRSGRSRPVSRQKVIEKKVQSERSLTSQIRSRSVSRVSKSYKIEGQNKKVQNEEVQKTIQEIEKKVYEKFGKDENQQNLESESTENEKEQEKEEKEADNLSWVSSSSHRMYIEELKKLLEIEKTRRIKAENALVKINSS